MSREQKKHTESALTAINTTLGQLANISTETSESHKTTAVHLKSHIYQRVIQGGTITINFKDDIESRQLQTLHKLVGFIFTISLVNFYEETSPMNASQHFFDQLLQLFKKFKPSKQLTTIISMVKILRAKIDYDNDDFSALASRIPNQTTIKSALNIDINNQARKTHREFAHLNQYVMLYNNSDNKQHIETIKASRLFRQPHYLLDLPQIFMINMARIAQPNAKILKSDLQKTRAHLIRFFSHIQKHTKEITTLLDNIKSKDISNHAKLAVDFGKLSVLFDNIDERRSASYAADQAYELIQQRAIKKTKPPQEKKPSFASMVNREAKKAQQTTITIPDQSTIKLSQEKNLCILEDIAMSLSMLIATIMPKEEKYVPTTQEITLKKESTSLEVIPNYLDTKQIKDIINHIATLIAHILLNAILNFKHIFCQLNKHHELIKNIVTILKTLENHLPNIENITHAISMGNIILAKIYYNIRLYPTAEIHMPNETTVAAAMHSTLLSNLVYELYDEHLEEKNNKTTEEDDSSPFIIEHKPIRKTKNPREKSKHTDKFITEINRFFNNFKKNAAHINLFTQAAHQAQNIKENDKRAEGCYKALKKLFSFDSEKNRFYFMMELNAKELQSPDEEEVSFTPTNSVVIESKAQVTPITKLTETDQSKPTTPIAKPKPKTETMPPIQSIYKAHTNTGGTFDSFIAGGGSWADVESSSDDENSDDSDREHLDIGLRPS